MRDTLSKAPAPRILLIHGGIYPVYLAMSSFADFLVAMGYPDAALRRDDSVVDSVYSYSPYQDSAQLAGMLAWYYERDGMRPMIVGHSQGGVQAVKVLDELAGVFGSEVPVWNPITDSAENRTTIVDPFTGARRPVVGVTVSYASAVGAGGAALLLPNQWTMAHRLRTIPDTVEELHHQHSTAELFLIVGADAASDLATWDRPDVLRDLTTIVIVSRADIDEPGAPGPGWRVAHVRIPPLAISSTDLRRRAASGEPLDGLMPPAAIRCLRERGLYAGRG